MARKAKLDVSTVFGAIDNTKAAINSVTKNMGKVRDASDKAADKVGVMGGRLGAVGQLMKSGGPLALGASALGGSLLALGLDAAATAQRIDKLIGRMGEIGKTHGEVMRQIGTQLGEQFLPGAEAIARVYGVEEMEAALENARSLDRLFNTDIPADEAGQLTAIIGDVFEASLEDAARAVGTLYDTLGGGRFLEIIRGSERAFQTLGRVEGVSLEDVLGFIRGADVAIQTPDALEEFIEDFGKALADSSTEIRKVFDANDGDIAATLEAMRTNAKAANELGEVARTQVPAVADALKEHGAQLEINADVLRDLAIAGTDLQDAFRLLKNTLIDEVDGPLGDALTTFKDFLLILSDNADKASGSIEGLQTAVNLLKGAFNVTAGGLGRLKYVIDATLDIVRDPNRDIPVTLREGGTADRAARLREEIEETRLLLTLPGNRGGGGNSSALYGRLNSLTRELNALQPGAVLDQVDPLGGVFGGELRPSRFSSNALRDMRSLNAPIPQSGLVASETLQILRGGFAELKEETAKSAEMAHEDAMMNMENRSENTQQVLEEQRLMTQGAC